MSSNSSTNSLIICSESRPAVLLFIAFSVSNIFLIPLFIYTLCLGVQRCRTQRSGSTSYLDIFTYNVVVLELLSLVGCCCLCCGALMSVQTLVSAAYAIFSLTSPGQSYFHVLTCVERYVAVVYPVAYRSLRHSGTRTRTAVAGGIWLPCLVNYGLDCLISPTAVVIKESCFFTLFVIIVTFCSFSVLMILINPKPGERGGDTNRTDQSKRRAFHVITLIMGVLWLRFLGVLVGAVASGETLSHAHCVLAASTSFLTTPGSLVLPLLFLKRAGKMQRCK
ncbi:uncharacterized protein LOC118600074 [Oryzias melastigma]|uniref:uncharacterized protein LOC118600074 n=1 Tax=Oryzias melastigma TaxID=30732 RepID=UPI00168D516E|nr:uncharacterized protein LOC118600074 [Oryzias melastigma]